MASKESLPISKGMAQVLLQSGVRTIGGQLVDRVSLVAQLVQAESNRS